MPILYDNPKEVGADRIANAVGAYDLYGGPAIVVDFGTATTVEAISDKGEYLGGAIFPGSRSRSTRCSNGLPACAGSSSTAPKHVIGKSTVESIQSGAIYGFSAEVDGLVDRFVAELGECDRHRDRRARGHDPAARAHRAALRALAHAVRPAHHLRAEHRWNPEAVERRSSARRRWTGRRDARRGDDPYPVASTARTRWRVRDDWDASSRPAITTDDDVRVAGRVMLVRGPGQAHLRHAARRHRRRSTVREPGRPRRRRIRAVPRRRRPRRLGRCRRAR